jgi:hypothetical protein
MTKQSLAYTLHTRITEGLVHVHAVGWGLLHPRAQAHRFSSQ